MDLLAKGLVEAPRVEDTERERVQLLGRLGELDANIARSASRIGEIRMRILAIDEIARTEAQRELVVVESRIQELADRITAVEDRLARTEIRAPIAGQIHEISVFTEGGVITPAEVLATIVPEGATLRTEIMLPTASIDQVFVGQDARIRFSSFNHRTTPEVMGRITYVSPATTTGRGDVEPYYIGHVELLPGQADRLGDLILLPGMQAEVIFRRNSKRPPPILRGHWWTSSNAHSERSSAPHSRFRTVAAESRTSSVPPSSRTCGCTFDEVAPNLAAGVCAVVRLERRGAPTS